MHDAKKKTWHRHAVVAGRFRSGRGACGRGARGRGARGRGARGRVEAREIGRGSRNARRQAQGGMMAESVSVEARIAHLRLGDIPTPQPQAVPANKHCLEHIDPFDDPELSAPEALRSDLEEAEFDELQRRSSSTLKAFAHTWKGIVIRVIQLPAFVTAFRSLQHIGIDVNLLTRKVRAQSTWLQTLIDEQEAAASHAWESVLDHMLKLCTHDNGRLKFNFASCNFTLARSAGRMSAAIWLATVIAATRPHVENGRVIKRTIRVGQKREICALQFCDLTALASVVGTDNIAKRSFGSDVVLLPIGTNVEPIRLTGNRALKTAASNEGHVLLSIPLRNRIVRILGRLTLDQHDVLLVAVNQQASPATTAQRYEILPGVFMMCCIGVVPFDSISIEIPVTISYKPRAQNQTVTVSARPTVIAVESSAIHDEHYLPARFGASMITDNLTEQGSGTGWRLEPTVNSIEAATRSFKHLKRRRRV